MKKTRAELKDTFTNGYKPDENDFADLFDSFLHQDDSQTASGVNLASKAEAEQGNNHTNAMSPLRTRQAIEFIVRLASLPGLQGDVQAEIQAAVTAIIDSAPGALDTLGKIADAINNDPAFHTSVLKVASNLADLHNVTDARANLEVYSRQETESLINGFYGGTWQLATMLNGWSTFNEPLRFAKTGNLVYVSGGIGGGTDSHVCTLPVGYRPQHLVEFYQVELAAAGFESAYTAIIRVEPTGELIISNSSTLHNYSESEPAESKRLHFSFIA